MFFWIRYLRANSIFPRGRGPWSTCYRGRGGRVIYVTNLNDSGTGSFRAAAETNGARTIVFQVGGTIMLNSTVNFDFGDVTVAGQTAPGDGITLANNKVKFKDSNIIVRYVRFRQGTGGDAIEIVGTDEGTNDIIFDHCSISFGTDENVGSIGSQAPVRNVTFQWCISSEGLLPHSMGMLLSKNNVSDVSVHHSLFAFNNARNPKFALDTHGELINCVIAGYGNSGARFDPGTRVNVIGNYAKAIGNNTKGFAASTDDRVSGQPLIYAKDNIGPGRLTNTGNEWDAFNADPAFQSSTPAIEPTGITTHSPEEAYELVLDQAGASLKRDAIDIRITNQVRNGTGGLIEDHPGFPTIAGGTAPADADADGMPDFWENDNGLDPNNPEDRNGDQDGDGYTNLEEYLNCILIPGCLDNTQENTAPTISSIADQVTDQDVAINNVAFTVSDAESAASALTVSAVSSNQTLVTNGNLVLGGSGTNRNITITPSSGQFGTTSITVTVSDGELTASEEFLVTVNEVTAENNPPVISAIGDQSTDQDIPLNGVAFTVSDPETSANQLTVTVSSSNPGVIPNGNITINGTGTNRNLDISPAAAAVGTSTVTVTVSDGELSDSESFLVTVNEVTEPNTAPTVSTIADQETDQDVAVNGVAFTIGDEESAASELIVTVSSSNQSLIPNGNITINGTGTNRNLDIAPASGEFGESTITLTVSDGGLSTNESFLVTVNQTTTTNTPPTISNIQNQTTDQNVDINGIAFTIGDTESVATDLTVSVVSDNQSLVPNANLVVAGSGSSRTLDMSPGTDQSGSANITVTVSDGELDASTAFVLTVVAPDPENTAPAISSINDISILQGETAAGSFTISDTETDVDNLTLTATSANQILAMDGDIQLTGSGTSRNFTITPQSGQTGTSEITITVNDGELEAEASFTLNVNEATPENTAPTISDIPNMVTIEDTPLNSIGFEVSDAEVDANDLIVTGTSSEQSVVSDAQITFGGSGEDRTVSIAPESGQIGSTIITISVSDGELTTSDSFTFTVNEAPEMNTPPSISFVGDQETEESTPIEGIAFMITDGETDASQLVVTAFSDNQNLVQDSQIEITGSGEDRALSISPEGDQKGTVFITVVVSDGELSASRTFMLTINEKDDTDDPGGSVDLDPANMFSPNGDGVDDFWVIGNIESYPNNHLRIYTRRGKKVFEAWNYNNDWDGTYKGRKLANGVYFFVLRYKGPNSPLRGSITLLR